MQTELSGELPTPNRNGTKSNPGFGSLAESEEFKKWARELDEIGRAALKDAWDNRPFNPSLGSYQKWAEHELEIMLTSLKFCDMVRTMEAPAQVFWALYDGGMSALVAEEIQDRLAEMEDRPASGSEVSDWVRSLPDDHFQHLVMLFFSYCVYVL